MTFTDEDLLYSEIKIRSYPSRNKINNSDYNRWEEIFREFKNSYNFKGCTITISIGREIFKRSKYHLWVSYREIDNLILQSRYEYSLHLLNNLDNEKINSKLLKAKVKTRLGDLLRIMGNHAVSIEKYKQSNTMLVSNNNEILYLYNIHMIGVSNWADEFFNEALYYYEVAIKAYRVLFLKYKRMKNIDKDYVSKKDDILKNISNVMRDISMVYRRRGEYLKAKLTINHSLSYFEETNMNFEILITLFELAKIFRDEKDWRNCYDANFRALNLAKSLGDKYQEATALFRLAEMNYLQGKIKGALSWAMKGKTISETYDFKFQLSRSFLILSLCKFLEGKKMEGKSYFDKAFITGERFNKNQAKIIIKNFLESVNNLTNIEKNQIIKEVGITHGI